MRKHTRPLAAVAIAATLAPTAGRADPLTVVELFTSQGCSSCPPADALLDEVADRPGVLALSEHVDYWDYLGWRDPFASSAFSARQREYAKRFGLKFVYTPQLVVQGDRQLQGADREALLSALASPPAPTARVAAAWSADHDLVVTINPEQPSSPPPPPSVVWLVSFDDRKETAVARGENGGRSLVNRHVVRDVREIGRWSGGAMTTTIAGREITTGDQCAILVQAHDVGAILGAARCASRDLSLRP